MSSLSLIISFNFTSKNSSFELYIFINTKSSLSVLIPNKGDLTKFILILVLS